MGKLYRNNSTEFINKYILKMQKKILILVLFLAPVLLAQDENSFTKKQQNNDKLTLISVTIGGEFIVNGSYPASFAERIDQFITRVYNEARNVALTSATDQVALSKLREQLARYAKRGIILKRASGESINIDLEKFRLTGDFKYNPYLLNDDVIIFPGANIETNFIVVEGAVNFPLKFQFVDGDNLSDAILFARGINPVYENADRVEIYRLDKTGNREEIIKAGIHDVVPLKIGDRIKVMSDENFKKDFFVTVLGEVNSPGKIFIKKNQTTIKEVIERAGGFTPDASTEFSELLRGTNSRQVLRMQTIKDLYEKNPELVLEKKSARTDYQNLEYLLMSRMSDMAAEDSLIFFIDNTLRVLNSPGLVDFTKVLTGPEGNFLVKDGDIILVPAKEQLVFLFGQVLNPGYVEYVEGKDYNYYVGKAGGFGSEATNNTKIIKAKSRAWIEADAKTVIEPGDFIYVPKSVSHDWGYYLKELGSAAMVLSGVATFIYFVFVAK